MVNTTVSNIIALFMNLSQRSQQDTLETLTRIAGRNLPVAEGPQQARVPSAGPSQVVAPSNSTRVHAWDRPPVSNLPFAIRQRERAKSLRNSEEGRADGKLLSAAIAAVNRGRLLQISDEELLSSLQGVGDDLERLRSLWPRIREDPPQNEGQAPVREEEVVEAPQVPQPEERNVVNPRDPLYALEGTRIARGLFVTIVTQVTLSGDDIITGRAPPELQPIPPAHLSVQLNADVASVNVSLERMATAFASGEVRNYTAIARYMRYRNSDGRIVLVDVPLSWGDQNSDSDGSPSPRGRGAGRRKKRLKRRNSPR